MVGTGNAMAGMKPLDFCEGNMYTGASETLSFTN